MIRLLLNLIARLFGWSPVGRRICFVAGEGPTASELVGQIGEILELRLSASDPTETLVVRLEEPVRLVEGETRELVLVPRHHRFGAVALLTTGISVYVFPVGEPDVPPTYGKIIALMDIRLSP